MTFYLCEHLGEGARMLHIQRRVNVQLLVSRQEAPHKEFAMKGDVWAFYCIHVLHVREKIPTMMAERMRRDALHRPYP